MPTSRQRHLPGRGAASPALSRPGSSHGRPGDRAAQILTQRRPPSPRVPHQAKLHDVPRIPSVPRAPVAPFEVPARFSRPQAPKSKQNKQTHEEFFAEISAMIFARRRDLRSVFLRMDADRSGVLSTAELKRGLAELLRRPVEGEAIDALVAMIDKNGDGGVDFGEFASKMGLPAHWTLFEPNNAGPGSKGYAGVSPLVGTEPTPRMQRWREERRDLDWWELKNGVEAKEALQGEAPMGLPNRKADHSRMYEKGHEKRPDSASGQRSSRRAVRAPPGSARLVRRNVIQPEWSSPQFCDEGERFRPVSRDGRPGHTPTRLDAREHALRTSRHDVRLQKRRGYQALDASRSRDEQRAVARVDVAKLRNLSEQRVAYLQLVESQRCGPR